MYYDLLKNYHKDLLTKLDVYKVHKKRCKIGNIWLALGLSSQFIKKLSTGEKPYFCINESYTPIYPHYPHSYTTSVARVSMCQYRKCVL